MSRWMWCTWFLLAGCSSPEPAVESPAAEALYRSTGLPVDTGAGWVVRSVDQADPFVSGDKKLVPMTDPEFEPNAKLVTWLDVTSSEVWVAGVKAKTGELLPSDGYGALAGESVISMLVIHNGPEWVNTPSGPQVLFTEQDPQGVFHMRRAYETSPHVWQSERLVNGQDMVAGTGSMNPDGRFVYKDTLADTMRWRNIDDTEGGLLGPWDIYSGPRFVQGADLVVWNKVVNGVSQLFEFNLASGAETQLTFGADRHGDGAMWDAPELGGERLLLALRFNGDNPEAIEVYRDLGAGWEVVHEITGSVDLPYLTSPEFMVVGGESYISFLASNHWLPNSTTESHVFLVSALPTGSVFRKLSNNKVIRRSDPEPVSFNNHSYVYFNVNPAQGRMKLRRAKTGL